MNDVVIAADVARSDEDDVGEMTSGLDAESTASVTSHVLALQQNYLHHQPVVDRHQFNCIATPRHVCQAEPDEFHASADTSSVRNEGQTASSSETTNGSKTAVSDIKKQCNANDTDTIGMKSEPLLELRIDTACDSLAADDKLLVPGKYRVRFKRFKGIGPTDEATGVPIASRTVRKSYI